MEARNCRDLLLNKLLQLRPLTLLTPQIHNYKYKCTNTNTTNTQVHKYALDSIVTHICSLLIGVLHSLVECRNPNTEQQCQILHCLKSVAPDPQAVPVSHDPAYIDPGPDPVPNNYNRLCRHLPSRRLCWNWSFGEWSAMNIYFKAISHIFSRNQIHCHWKVLVKKIGVEICLIWVPRCLVSIQAHLWYRSCTTNRYFAGKFLIGCSSSYLLQFSW